MQSYPGDDAVRVQRQAHVPDPSLFSGTACDPVAAGVAIAKSGVAFIYSYLYKYYSYKSASLIGSVVVLAL